jgi:hypothetical protein
MSYGFDDDGYLFTDEEGNNDYEENTNQEIDTLKSKIGSERSDRSDRN